MLLSIVTKNSMKYKAAINATCKWVGLVNYEILDPKFHDLDKSFSLVLFIGEAPNKIMPSKKSWLYEHYPTADLPAATKGVLIQILKEAKDYMEDNRLPDVIKPTDIPPIKSLKEFLNDLTGRVVEIKLPDRRKLGIYPDDTKIQNKYDIEFHASVVVNLAKLFNLFDASEIIIKET